MNKFHRPLALAACAALLSACGPSAADGGSGADDELVFAAIPSEESQSLRQDYQPVIDLIAAETGKEVVFQQATDYAAVIEGQRAGKIDIAKYGPFSYVLARSQGVPATAVAAQVAAKGVEPGYRSYAITRPDSGITDLAGFRGEQVCFVDPTSTSGYLYPKAGLLQAGVDPERDIRPVFSGGHDAAALAVAHGDCDAGFAYDTMVDRQLVEKGQLKPDELKVLWRSQVIPSDPVALSDDLDPALRETITRALSEQANSDRLRERGLCTGECPIGDQNGWGFTGVDDSFYDGIRDVCRATRDEQCS